MDPPTFSLQEVGPGVVRPVLSKPIRVDPESGAVCWCAPRDDLADPSWIPEDRS
jgi:hypothetical protein